MTSTTAEALGRWGDHDRDDPFPLYAEVLAEGPVHDVVLADGHRAFLVLGYAAAREALNHPDLSKDMHAALARDGAVLAEGLPGPAFARHMLSVDPPDHTRLRALTAPAFRRARLDVLEPRIRALSAGLVEELVEEVGRDGTVDLVAGYARPLPFAVLGELIGVGRDDQRMLADWFGTLLAPSPGPEPSEAAVTASDAIVGFLADLVDERLRVPTDDLVGELATACRADQLSRQELMSTIFQVVVAGHDTTASLIGNGMAALLSHPGQRDRLVADPALVPRAVEELLRFDAPVPHSTFRYAVRDLEIAWVRIPEGVQVLVSLVTAGRDPARTDDPDRLDVTRTDGHHLAFGHGIHHCLGARLARVEAEIAFTDLLSHFPRMTLAVPHGNLRWQHGDGLVLRGLSALPVRLG